MRTYKLLGREYEDFDLFIAAKRDLEKIESLDIEKGTEPLDNADALLRQIHERKMEFESDLGEEFLGKVEKNVKGYKAPPKKETPKAPEPRQNHRKNSGYRLLRTVRNTSVAALFGIICLMGAVLLFNVRSESMGKEKFTQLRVQKEQDAAENSRTGRVNAILPEYASLHQQNPDMMGWLKIDFTSIDYPVVFRSDDNDYYLSRNFDGDYDANGMLILDKRCDPVGNGNNMLIHGHNMRSGLMFGSLRKYIDEGYFRDHRFIQYDTLYEKRTYEVMSVFISSLNEESGDFRYYDYINIDEPAAYEEYVRGVKAASLYGTDVEASFGDKLLTLSTCDYSRDNGRLVVVAKQVN